MESHKLEILLPPGDNPIAVNKYIISSFCTYYMHQHF